MKHVFCIGEKGHVHRGGHGEGSNHYTSRLTHLGLFATKEAAEAEINTLCHPLLCSGYSRNLLTVIDIPVKE